MQTFSEFVNQIEYKPGDTVPESGIYQVQHDPGHEGQHHEITAIEGKVFPPCGGCAHPRYTPARRTKHLSQ